MKLLVSPGVRNRDISLSSGTIQLNPGTNKMKLLSHIVGISCYRTFIQYSKHIKLQDVMERLGPE